MTKQQNTNAREMEDLELETLHAIFKAQKEKVKKLYDKAEHLFTKGNNYSKSIIANKFVRHIKIPSKSSVYMIETIFFIKN